MFHKTTLDNIRVFDCMFCLPPFQSYVLVLVCNLIAVSHKQEGLDVVPVADSVVE